jgi:hypothetical protein
LRAFILVEKSAVPSHEVCRHRGQLHPQLAVCTVNQLSHYSDADGGIGVDMYLLGNSFIYLNTRYLRVYKLIATGRRTQYRNPQFQGK